MRFLLLISVVTWYMTCSNAIMSTKGRGHKSVDLQALRVATESIIKFAPNFYEALAKNISGDVVCSPVSAFMLMSMVSYGAQGKTRKQIENALTLTSNNIEMGLQAIIDNLRDYTHVKLRLANKMYLRKGLRLKKAFSNVTRIAFRAEVESIDFGNTANVSNTINGWCATQTDNLIKDVISVDDVNSHSAFLLINAVYFKGNWAKKFDVIQTKNSPFNIDRKNSKNIPTMFTNDNFAYGELPLVDATFVELPYEHSSFGDSISMVIILPNKIEGLDHLEKNIHKVSLVELLCGTTHKVSLALPKFKIEGEISLESAFRQMNVTDIFGPTANFNGIIDYSSLPDGLELFVQKIVQKVFIEVDENGSKAAAVSVLDMASRMGGDDDDKIFHADRPFMFFIITKGENPLPLFIGRYTGPENMDCED